MNDSVKCAVLGDGAVGKTCFLIKYTTGNWNGVYSPSLVDKYAASIMVDGKLMHLELIDTPGQEEYTQLRVHPFQEADVFLVCFSLVNRDSYENVQNKWMQEIRQHAPGTTPIILVGTKVDLRDDEDHIAEMEKYGKRPTEKWEGLALAGNIKAVNYLECSAVTGLGMEAIAREAIRVVEARRNPPPRDTMRERIEDNCVCM